MYRTLEDEFGDIVGKARRGQEMDPSKLAAETGISAEDISRIESYELRPSIEIVGRLAKALGLDANKLCGSAETRFFPRNPGGESGGKLAVEMMILGSSFLMNGYIAACRETGKGLCIDPGFDADTILKAAQKAGVKIERIVLTHGHHDHVGALVDVVKATSAPVYINGADGQLLGDLSRYIDGGLEEGDRINVGKVNFEFRATPGHTPGGMSLLADQVAFVGDALFAGSLGGTRSRSHYELQRNAVREKVLSLAGDTVLYPGHGPATTVAEERENNAFFIF